MREFQEKRRLKKLLHSRYAIAVLAILCVFIGNAVWSVYLKYDKSREIVDRSQTELASLSAREDALASSIADLETEQGIEREVRERFGAVKEGEKLIVLVEPLGSKNGAAPVLERGWWDRLVALFTRD